MTTETSVAAAFAPSPGKAVGAWTRPSDQPPSSLTVSTLSSAGETSVEAEPPVPVRPCGWYW